MGNHRCLRRHRRPVPGKEVIQQWADAIHSDWGDVEVSLDEVLHDGGDVVVVAERLRGRDRARGMTLRSASTPRTGSRTGRSEGARRAPRARSPSKPPGCRSSADGAGFFLTGLRLALTFSRLAPSPVLIARSSRSTPYGAGFGKGSHERAVSGREILGGRCRRRTWSWFSPGSSAGTEAAGTFDG